MYDLVMLKSMGMYITSVFDKRNNEIWNNKTFYDLVVPDLQKQKFKFDNVVYNNDAVFALDSLFESGCVTDNAMCHNVSDVVQEDEYIANENMGVYGYARYLQRMLLKELKSKTC
jgi:hypothetical protein